MKIKVDLNNYKKEDQVSGVRLNKYLSDIGVLSRRDIDKLITEKKIHINDKVAILGEKIKSNDTIFINQKLETLKYFIHNKARGEETLFKIIDKIRYEPIGRLDKDSEGLLIYSNDYKLVDRLLNPKNKYEREYLVTVREKTTPRVKSILEKGIQTKEAKYAPAKKVVINEENKNIINITLTEGKKHEIRRMLNALNLTITSLKRVRFLSLSLGKIKVGEFYELKGKELENFLNSLNKK